MLDKLEQMEATINQIKTDVAKFTDKGNQAAGTRVRLAMQEIKKQAQEVRVMVSEAKK